MRPFNFDYGSGFRERALKISRLIEEVLELLASRSVCLSEYGSTCGKRVVVGSNANKYGVGVPSTLPTPVFVLAATLRAAVVPSCSDNAPSTKGGSNYGCRSGD